MKRLRLTAYLMLVTCPAVSAVKVGTVVFSPEPMTEEKLQEEYETRNSYVFGADISIHARAYLPYKYAKQIALIEVETGADKVLNMGYRLTVYAPDDEEPLFTWVKTGGVFIKNNKDQAELLSILPNEFGVDTDGQPRTLEHCARERGDPPTKVPGAYRVTYTLFVELAGPFEYESGGYAWTDEATLAEGTFEFVVP